MKARRFDSMALTFIQPPLLLCQRRLPRCEKNKTIKNNASNDNHLDPHLAEPADHFFVDPAVRDHTMDALDVSDQRQALLRPNLVASAITDTSLAARIICAFSCASSTSGVDGPVSGSRPSTARKK